MADSDSFKCPKCKHVFTVAETELYDVYEVDGKQTEFDCTKCDTEFVISSEVTGWKFSTELSGEDED